MNDEYGFRSLVLWKEAQDLAAEVTKALSALPSDRQVNVMVNQTLRSAGSVPANIAEGYGRFYEGAYRNYLSIARGSLFETESWLDLLTRAGYLPDDVCSILTEHCHRVGRLLTTRMKQLQTRINAVREEDSIYDASDITEELVT